MGQLCGAVPFDRLPPGWERTSRTKLATPTDALSEAEMKITECQLRLHLRNTRKQVQNLHGSSGLRGGSSRVATRTNLVEFPRSKQPRAPRF